MLLADSLFDNYFLICELRRRGIDVVARAQYERVGSQVLRGGPDGEILLWQAAQQAARDDRAQYRPYPEVLLMRQVTVDARDKENRAERFEVVTTILDASIDGGQIGDLYERRWEGEVDIRSIKSVMHMDILRLQAPEMVRKEIWAHLLAYNLLRTAMAVAAGENGLEPRQCELQGGQAGGDGVRAEARGGAAEGPPGTDRRDAGGDRVPSRRRPPGAVGAAGTEVPAEAGCLPARTASRYQTGEGSLEMVLKLVPCVRRHRRAQEGSPVRRSIRPDHVGPRTLSWYRVERRTASRPTGLLTCPYASPADDSPAQDSECRSPGGSGGGSGVPGRGRCVESLDGMADLSATVDTPGWDGL